MANMITIKVVKNEWNRLIKVLGSSKTQKALGDAGNKVAHRVKNNMVAELTKKDLIWRGKLRDSIQVRRRGNINRVTALGYGVALDSMKPHAVYLKRGRKVTQWSKEKRGIGSGFMYVRPHPWIRRPVANGLRTATTALRFEINKLLKQAKQGG